jgi:hypothetical protein
MLITKVRRQIDWLLKVVEHTLRPNDSVNHTHQISRCKIKEILTVHFKYNPFLVLSEVVLAEIFYSDLRVVVDLFISPVFLPILS